MDITDEYVEKVKDQTKVLAKNDLMDVSYITKELLSHVGTLINESSLEASVYHGNRWYGTSDPQTGESLIGFHSDSAGQDACGETIKLIPAAYYTITQGGLCTNGYRNYSFRHK